MRVSLVWEEGAVGVRGPQAERAAMPPMVSEMVMGIMRMAARRMVTSVGAAEEAVPAGVSRAPRWSL